MFVAKDIQDAGLNDKVPTLDRWKFEPTSYKNPKHVAMGKDQRIITELLQAPDDPVTSIRNLLGTLPTGALMCKNSPLGILLTDLFGRNPFMVAIMPFGEIFRHLDLLTETGKLTGSEGSFSRAAEHEFEIPS
jgi:hypothetical protein